LIRLGRVHSGNNKLPEDLAYDIGLRQYVVGFEDLKSIFKKDPDLRSQTIIVVSNNSSDGATGITEHYKLLEGGSQMTATRLDVYKFSDAIFSSREKDVKYFSGLGTDSLEEVTRKCGSLKPCFHGCDAHENSKIFKPDLGRFCWIKADPTFEGLKQTKFEPIERVRIQELTPEDKDGYQVIDSVHINGKVVFNRTLEFNPNLNTIIGGRSTGKSILLTAIAKKLKTDQELLFEGKEVYSPPNLGQLVKVVRIL